MKQMKLINCFLFFTLLSFQPASAMEGDSIAIRNIYNEALSKGHAYEDLHSLCKDIGARLSGSAQAAMAVDWAKRKMINYGFENVRLEPVMVPHWERGTREVGWFQTKNGELTPVELLALGGSIGTNGILKAEVVVFNSLEALKQVKNDDLKGKVVFINQPMNPADIVTFKAYGGCYSIRGEGAVEAAKNGAIAVIIRSLALPQDHFPHTGSMHYETDVPKIPAAALSTESANQLEEALHFGKIQFIFEMNCLDFPDILSYNVVGELNGTSDPTKIITIGGHLDSWDTGEGAHDDGAGIIHCLEAVRILKVLKIKPKHTIRIVCFMNEENGNKGGQAYALNCKAKNEQIIAAIESDRGGFSPRGFECDGTPEQLQFIQQFKSLLLPYGLYHFEKGYGGVDIGPLKNQYSTIPLFGFVPDSQRYFDFHHAASDVFENVNKRELELGAGSMAAFVYLLDLNM
jgi:hypothetical protein